MRQVVEEKGIRRFMQELGAAARDTTRVYFTGGTSAVLLGWREATIDVDMTLVPDRDEILRALPKLKEDLDLNVELVSPSHFLPELPGWEDRSVFIANEGPVSFFHYDFYAQALSKIERGHDQDLLDVDAMVNRGLVEPDRLEALLDEIEPKLYRFPAVDPPSLRAALVQFLRDRK